MNKVYD